MVQCLHCQPLKCCMKWYLPMAVLWPTGAICWREHSQTRRAHWEDKERGSDFFLACLFTTIKLTFAGLQVKETCERQLATLHRLTPMVTGGAESAMEGMKADKMATSSFVFLLKVLLPLRCLPTCIVHAHCYAKGPHIQSSSSSLLPSAWFLTVESDPASIHIQNARLEQGRILHSSWPFGQP